MNPFDSNALPSSFYARNPVIVAEELLGKILANHEKNEWLAGRIVETEAYLGQDDPSSHAFRGPTPRASIMFESPGRSYVYFVYGNHHCFNVVAHEGHAGAVLIRALEPIHGIDLMKKNRNLNDEKNLTNGPGKLTQALGISKAHNGQKLDEGNLQIFDAKPPSEPIVKSTRIGISKARSKRYRFSLKKNPYVSKPHPW